MAMATMPPPCARRMVTVAAAAFVTKSHCVCGSCAAISAPPVLTELSGTILSAGSCDESIAKALVADARMRLTAAVMARRGAQTVMRFSGLSCERM